MRGRLGDVFPGFPCIGRGGRFVAALVVRGAGRAGAPVPVVEGREVYRSFVSFGIGWAVPEKD